MRYVYTKNYILCIDGLVKIKEYTFYKLYINKASIKMGHILKEDEQFQG